MYVSWVAVACTDPIRVEVDLQFLKEHCRGDLRSSESLTATFTSMYR